LPSSKDKKTPVVMKHRTCKARTSISVIGMLICAGTIRADFTNVFSLVPEAGDYELIYGINLPNNMSLGTSGIPVYDTNNADSFAAPFSYDRVAYYMELQESTSTSLTWVYVSAEDFARNATHLGIPAQSSGAMFQRPLFDMNVFAGGGADVTTGTNIQTGNIEFWGFNYGKDNAASVPHARDDLHDTGDTLDDGGNYGSMQIHNHDVDGPGPGTSSETVFAYNRWGIAGNDDLGIGSGPASSPDWTFEQNAGSYALKSLAVLVRPVQGPEISFTAFPQDFQLYPRDRSNNQADVRVEGAVLSPGYDEINVRVYRNGLLQGGATGQTLVYSKGAATFSIGAAISAELASYDVEVFVVQGVQETLAAWARDVVAGDVLLINGQSNAAAMRFSGSANQNQHRYLRSFGSRSENLTLVESDLGWHVAEGNTATGPGTIGQWGLRLGRLLVDVHRMPVAVLNGARGGQPIGYFQRNDSDPEDSSTNYGRLLFLCRTAGLTNGVRTMSWYQGEAEQGDGPTHEAGFVELYQDWKEDFPGLERVYVHQLRTGCSITDKNDPGLLDLRDRQRRLADTFGDISVMSTTGLNGHDGCHYEYTSGYKQMGERLFRIMSRDLYETPDRANIDAPNIGNAFFSKDDGSEITLVMRNATDTLHMDAGVEADFLLSGTAATVALTRAAGNRVILELSGNGQDTTGTSYTGHRGVGAWGTNSLGVGMLSFYNVPVDILSSPPSIPTGLRASRTAYPQVKLHWNEITNAASFVVRRNGAIVGTPLSATFVDYGLSADTEYQYDVVAVNPAGMSLFSSVLSVTTGVALVFGNVPEASNYTLIYSLEIPDQGNFRNVNPVPYLDDNSASFTSSFDRVAYYLELETFATQQWVYASMDAFTPYVDQVGLPHNVFNPVSYQMFVSNMNVFASEGANVTTGLAFQAGNVEFWPNSYGKINGAAVPNATGTAFDAGDKINISSNPGYGSFQVHHYDKDEGGSGTAGETVFAYNRWGTANNSELGIGNRPGSLDTDWTYSQNAPTYTIKNLMILVRASAPPLPPASPANLVVDSVSVAHADLSWNSVSDALFYDVRANGGPWGESRSPFFRAMNLEPDTEYTFEVAARNTGGTSAFSDPMTTTTLSARVFQDVPEAGDFEPVYVLDIENSGNYRNHRFVPYSLDRASLITQPFDRIAYHLEVVDSGGRHWVYVSMDPFSGDVKDIGIPHHLLEIAFQQAVTNMNVFAGGGAKVTTGSGIQTGNIEMWPHNYSRDNAAAVPNAADNSHDFGDQITTSVNPGYGSFQIHNYDLDGPGAGTMGQTILAYNRWGRTGVSDLGIGNHSVVTERDWTFAQNATTYIEKRISILVRLFDKDEDGLPDAWERDEFGHLDQGPNDDLDGDGHDNLEEYIANTRAADSNSVLRLSIEPASDGGVKLVFDSAMERVYQADASEVMENEAWSNILTGIIGSGGAMELVVTNQAPGIQFFRLHVDFP